MTIENAPSQTSAVTSTDGTAGPVAATTAPSWPWRRGAMLLAGAAQPITISALVAANPPPRSWAALLLAIAPAPLAAAAVFLRAPLNRLAALAALAVLIAGIAGAIPHTGLFFVPALVVLAVGTVMLWREQS